MNQETAAALAATVDMTIGGAGVAAPGTFGVVNPSTGEVFANAPRADKAVLDTALSDNAQAFESWRQDDAARRSYLDKAADAVAAATDDIAALISAEQGKVLTTAKHEVRTAVAWLRYYASLELPREIVQDNARGFSEVVRDPLGVVAAITPWNFPISLAMWKIAPALRAGNTVLLKPSPYTPLSSLRLGQALRDVLPPGVLNVVTGLDELGPWLTAHPVPRKISFTGSIETGKRVAAAAAADLKRVTLELGGNDPAIVLDDADVDAIADELFWGAFTNSGQICLAIKRVYAPQNRYQEVVDALVARAEQAVIGDPFDPASTMGPVSNRPQLDLVSELVSEAVEGGAVAASGGRRLEGNGFFYAPTILRDVSDGARIVDIEQFGPALPVVPYTDVDEVVGRINAGHYGLTATVWGSDADRAEAIARRLEYGTVSVNTHSGGIGPHLPFGGHKWSGLGVENGPWGLHGFTDLKLVHRKK